MLLASSGRVTVAALDSSGNCYSTQFHPDGTYNTKYGLAQQAAIAHEKLSSEENGRLVVENFLRLVVNL